MAILLSSHATHSESTSPEALTGNGIACLTGQPVQTARLAGVIDGDTILLDDGRRVRLIGVNALELNASSTTDQRWAQAASDVLTRWLGNQPLHLVFGHTRSDRYGRTLAHVVLDTGQLASETLIRQGLALAVSVGKNTRCATQLQHAETLARERQLGIWSQPGDWLVTGKSLNGHEKGFRLVRSRVALVEGSRRKTVIHLSNGLHIFVGSQWRALSKQFPRGIQSLTGRQIEVKGWLQPSSGKVQLSLHHSSNLRAPRH